MIVTVILLITFTYTMVTFRAEKRERRVEAAAREFYSTLLYARNLATTGKVWQDELNDQGIPAVGGDGEVDVPNGYGLRLYSASGSGGAEFTRYFVFGDLYSNSQAKVYDHNVLEERLAVDVSFDAGVLAESAVGAQPLDIFFETEWGTITFSDVNDELTGATLTVNFTDRQNANTRQSVIINRLTNKIYVR